MQISELTTIGLNLGTVVVVGFWLWKTSSNISKFKTKTEDSILSCQTLIQQLSNELLNHKQEDKKNKISERLARIETDIQWIRKSLDKK